MQQDRSGVALAEVGGFGQECRAFSRDWDSVAPVPLFSSKNNAWQPKSTSIPYEKRAPYRAFPWIFDGLMAGAVLGGVRIAIAVRSVQSG